MFTHPVGFRGAGGYGSDFVMVFATTAPAETLTIPCGGGTFNATIDWGDDSTSEITAYTDPDLTHEYADAGDHIVRISGTFPNIRFGGSGDKLKLKKVLNFGDTGFQDLYWAFWGCANLTEVGGSSNMSSVTNMYRMFRECTSLTMADVTGWDVSSATNLSQLFYSNTALSSVIGLSGWNTSLVTDMSFMFVTCPNLLDASIDGWNIEAVTSFTNFMSGVTLPTARYDATLIAWDAQNPVDSLSVHFGSSKYTSGGSADAARSNLVSTDLWTITDGGAAP